MARGESVPLMESVTNMVFKLCSFLPGHSPYLFSKVLFEPSSTFMNTSSIVVTETPKLDTPRSALQYMGRSGEREEGRERGREEEREVGKKRGR